MDGQNLQLDTGKHAGGMIMSITVLVKSLELVKNENTGNAIKEKYRKVKRKIKAVYQNRCEREQMWNIREIDSS